MSKAILLLHGFITDENDFAPIIPELEKRYDYVDKMIFPGHGTKGDMKDFTLQDTYQKLDEEMNMLLSRFDGIDVLGFSMGGAIGVYVAGKYKVNKLVLLAPANRYLNLSFIANKLSLQIDIAKNIRNNKEEEAKQKEHEYLKELRLDEKNSLDMAVKRLIPEWTPRNINTFAKVIKKANTINEYNVPTLIIWGKLDQLVPKRSIVYVYKKCVHPIKKVVEYEDISHLMLRSQQKDKIINEIVAFLDNA